MREKHAPARRKYLQCSCAYRPFAFTLFSFIWLTYENEIKKIVEKFEENKKTRM